MLDDERGARGVCTTALILATGLLAHPARANPAAAPSETQPADAGRPVAPSQPNEPKPVPNWSIRVGIAGGAPILSDQEELLELEGYAGMRWNTSLAVSRKLTDVVGVGGLLLYGWRSADAEPEQEYENLTGVAPSYDETLIALGAQAPLSFGLGAQRKAVFFVTPWAGVGFAKAEFESGGNWQAGPALGASTGVFFPRVFLGIATGVYFVPLPAPGEAGGHNDLGMIYLSLVLGADVG
jgi:hypothetical protein